jgi:hypothetical protein
MQRASSRRPADATMALLDGIIGTTRDVATGMRSSGSQPVYFIGVSISHYRSLLPPRLHSLQSGSLLGRTCRGNPNCKSPPLDLDTPKESLLALAYQAKGR